MPLNEEGYSNVQDNQPEAGQDKAGPTMKRGSNRIVCLCNGVTKRDILRALHKGARDFGEVQAFTRVSTNCGKCRPEAEALTQEYLKSKIVDLQRRIEF